jgi:N-acetylmuramoyl-L-alanine amidase
MQYDQSTGSSYYFKEDGKMAKGWVKYYDKWYYLNTSNGFMESNAFVKGKDGWYYISEDGTMAEKPDFVVEPEGLITVK